uniref:Uncharacterized protein n=1 Tax=Anguilla anguilla TaxID=7936 RepID=A0A0E9PGL1_ANGAN
MYLNKKLNPVTSGGMFVLHPQLLCALSWDSIRVLRVVIVPVNSPASH